MRLISLLFSSLYAIITALFLICAVILIGFAGREIWHVIGSWDEGSRDAFNRVLESIGLLTIAVAALELGQTILEEEVIRSTQISVPTRVRRFLSRFMIVVIVSLSIETLVATFELIHDDPAKLPYAASIALGAAALLIGWGLFIHLNRSAEELEPEALEQVQAEDAALEEKSTSD